MSQLAFSPHDMQDNLEAAVNGTEFENGHTDALGHIGMMLVNGKSAAAISDIQDEVLDPSKSALAYIIGYKHAWNATYKMLFDAAEARPAQ